MNNKNLLAAISVSTLLISSPFILASSPILQQTITGSLQNSLFAEAQYGGPIANDDSASTDVDTPVNIDVLDNDDLNGGVGPLSIDDGDCALTSFGSINTYADIDTNAANGNAVVIGTVPNHTITYTPNAGFTGVDTFTYQMCDTDTVEFSNIATVTVTVNATNQPPTLSNQSITISKGNSGAFSALAATDPDGNTPITFNTPTINPLLGCVESDTGNQGNIITCTPDNSISNGTYTFQLTPTDSLSLAGSPATFTVEVVDQTSPTVQIFKDKEDGTVQVNDNVKIQLDVSNPNPFDLSDLTVNSTVDSTKVSIVGGSVAEDQISGNKFSALNVQTQAQSFTSSINNNIVTIEIPLLAAGQTRSFVFDVSTLTTGVGDIDSVIIQNGSQVSSDTAQIPIDQPITTSTPRTGGRIINIALFSLFAVVGLGILSSIGLHTKQSKITKK